METFPVFISYSRKDIGQVSPIRASVEEAIEGKCWMDLKAIESGSKRFTKDIICGINNCKVFLFMLTENSQRSEFALRELDYADRKGKHVVIVNVNDCLLTDEFQFLYGLTDTISWSDNPQKEKLLRDLKRWVGVSEPKPDLERKERERQEAELKAKKERERQEAELKAKEEQERQVREAAEKARQEAEKERQKQEQRRKEAERKAKEEAEKARLEQERLEKEKRNREEAALRATQAEEFGRKARYDNPSINNPHGGFTPLTQLSKDTRKSKKGLWISLCAVAVVALLIVLLSINKGGSGAKAGDLTITANGVSFVMKSVKGGTFQMGSTDSEADGDERPVHLVTVSSFYIGETEVTQALWEAVMGDNPSYFKGDNLPVEQITWNDCKGFIRKLNKVTGMSFRLPTEAEWEYAARGGKSKGTKYAGSNDLSSVAWYNKNSGRKTHAVKGRSPNELGIYDMSGNVWEWCSDMYDDYSSGAQTDPNPQSTSKSFSCRVLRGGGWSNEARYCRVSLRNRYYPDIRRTYSLGFRLALSQ